MVSKDRATPERQRWSPFWPIILILIGWGAVIFNYIDRHWLSDDSTPELPLADDNANLGASISPALLSAQKQYYVNFVINNNSKSSAIGMQHFGMIALSPSPIPEPIIKQILAMTRIILATTPPSPTPNEIHPGQTGEFFTLLGQEVSKQQADQLDKAALLPYIINVMRYRDSHIAPDEFIYTETCQYYVGKILHDCETGHNRSFISK